MLHPIPGGANAKPFVTHHNALDQQMFLRIAPELYLKRLMVGGFERVFEINRSFRNEGISVRHNPEFTMMEFYAAYWNHHDLMDFTEAVLRHAARQATGSATLSYAGKPVDLDAPFARLIVREALVAHAGLSEARGARCRGAAARTHQGAGRGARPRTGRWPSCSSACSRRRSKSSSGSRPSSSTIRSRCRRWRAPSDTDPAVTERFELFITGREMRQRLLRAERRRGPGRALPGAGRQQGQPATKRRCTTTPTSSARSSTACRPPAAAASASTG